MELGPDGLESQTVLNLEKQEITVVVKLDKDLLAVEGGEDWLAAAVGRTAFDCGVDAAREYIEEMRKRGEREAA